MSRTNVTINTRDGACPASVFKPDGGGPWPAVVMFMDGPGIRPTLFDMGERLAAHGYYVLLPDMYYRDGPYEPVTDFAKLFGDEAARAAIFAKMGKVTNPENARSDAEAFLAFLAAQPEVSGGRVAVTGYCMGGGLALRAAANFPERVAAAGAFHPGHLTTDAPDSPHLLADRIKAKVYVGGADNDAGFTPEHKTKLEQALADAGVDHRVEIYEGALHGYTMKDAPIYKHDAAERHWREMLALFDGALKTAA